MYDILQMPQYIEIGYTGETNFRTIQIDLSGWLETMPNGVPSIVHILPGQSQADAYIVATTFENKILTWNVNASDIGDTEGTGLAQVWLEEAANNTLNKRGMSAVFATLVRQSVSDMNTDVPEPQIPWLQQMTQLKTETVNAKIEAGKSELAAQAAQALAEEWATGGSGGTPSASNNAKAYALKAEGYAVGKQNGEAVESGDYFHNNAEYYADQAADSAQTASDKAGEAAGSAVAAAGSASEASSSASAASGSAGDAASSASAASSSAAEALVSSGNASSSASTAQGYAGDAESSAELAHQWATYGDEDEPGEENNAAYWAEQAAESAEHAADAVQEAIDDTAGDGDTDKLWSANKIYDELALKAPKASPEFTGSISLGRKENTTVGTNSFAVGTDVEAKKNYSHAEGKGTVSDGQAAHAEGWETLADGRSSHAEGRSTSAVGQASHAEGYYTEAVGDFSHVVGSCNVSDSERMWAANTHYYPGDRVTVVADTTYMTCKTEHTSSNNFNNDTEYWEATTGSGSRYAEIVGNGANTSNPSNARVLEWNGNEHIAGDIYVNCNDDSTGGTALGAEVTGVKSTIGYVPSGSTVMGKIAEANSTIGTVPTGHTVMGDISDVKSAISDSQGNIILSKDLKSEIYEYTEELFIKSVKDISNNSYTAQIISNLWSRSGRCAIVSVPSDVIKISVTANSSLSTDIAFLTSNAHSGNTAPNFVAGTSVITIGAGTTYTSVKHTGCTYMYILKSTTDGGSDRVPAEIGFYTLKDVLLLDQSLTISGDSADAKVTGDSIRELQDRLLYTAEEKDISNNYYTAMISNGVWVRDGRCAIVSVPDDVVKILVKANNSLSTDIAFLTSNSHDGQTAPDYVAGTGITTINAGISQLLQKPESCTYLYILKSTTEGGEDRVPSKIVYYAYKEQSASLIPLGLHEMPRDTNALNIVKRCRQMTDIKWTPPVDLPRYMLVQRGDNIPDSAEPQNYLGTFKAGVEYTGIPYGRVTNTMTSYGYSYATVGRYIGFETFISAVENPNSIIPTSHVGSVSNHRSIMYATVCSGMTCYALNVPEVPTASIPNISGLQLIGKINNNGTLLADSEFKIGDVLNKYDYHTAIITDIIRNTDGEIVLVELSDASTAGLADKNYSDGQIGGICRRKGWTRQQLFDASSWGDYSLYRYSGSVPYVPNPYVNVGDEFDMRRIEHFPCMPYEGNKFIYKTGYIPNNAVKILVSLSDYGYLKVFKNGTEISGSPFEVTENTKSINVSEIGAGTYTAYLCNITDGNVVNLTYPCEWTIE